jgi:hypothetical protein
VTVFGCRLIRVQHPPPPPISFTVSVWLAIFALSWSFLPLCRGYTDKKEKKIVLIYKEVQSGAAAKSYTRKGFLMYEEMRKYFPIYEEVVSHR